MAAIKQYLDRNYPGLREFFQDFMHDESCKNDSCLEAARSKVEICSLYNEHMRCFKRFTHEEEDENNCKVVKEHVCSNCMRAMGVRRLHRANCHTCPIKKIHEKILVNDTEDEHIEVEVDVE